MIRRQFKYHLGHVIALLITTVAVTSCGYAREKTVVPTAQEGVLDLTDWNFSKRGTIDLNGEWEFYWQKLLTPSDFIGNAALEPNAYATIPNYWSNIALEGESLPGKGYATYRLRVKTDTISEIKSLRIDHMMTAYTLWVNGEQIASNGKVGKTNETMTPEYLPQVVSFYCDQPEIELVVQISNFVHRNGGIWGAFTLGNEDHVRKIREKSMAFELALIGTFLIMFLYHVGLYVLRKKDQSSLYFGLLCLALTLRIMCTGQILLVYFFNIPWEMLLTVEYITFYMGIPLMALFMNSLYEQEIRRRFVLVLVLLGVSFSLLAFITPASFYTQTVLFYQFVTLISGAYVSYAMVKAVIMKRRGAFIFLLGYVVVFLAVVNDILHQNFIIQTAYLVPFGLFIFVFCQSFVLAMRFSKAFATVETMSERLLSMDRLKDEFLVSTSEKLKNPLNGMVGLTESLVDGARGKLNSGMKEDLSVIMSGGKRLSSLVSDILDFSKLRNKDIKLRLAPVDFRIMTDIAISLSQPLMMGKPVSILNQIPQDTPLVHGDENRIQQILLNLLSNAIKFTEKGTITIKAIVSKYNTLIVSVSDTGVGIPEERFKDIFESFERITGLTQARSEGMGIGLTITKQLIELHGGEIDVQSKMRKGSVFTFTLPLSPQDEGEHVLTQEVDMKALKNPITDGNLREDSVTLQENQGGFSILIVDDEPVSRHILKNQLKLHHYDVFEATDGEHALDLVMHGDNVGDVRFDLVILDVMMPKVSGYEVCRKIRERFPARLLPVILMTTNSQIEDLLVGFEAGANDYLIKPFSKHELLTRVKTHAQLLKANRELEAHGQSLEQRVEKRTAELKSKNERLSELNREKDGIIGIVAHDLKSPFNNISGLMQLLPAGGTLTEEQLEYIERVNGLVERSQGLIQDLLDANELEEQNTIVNLKAFNLGEFLHDKVSAYKQMLESKKQHLDIHLNDKALAITTDKGLLGRILDNLISNAIKFSETGTSIIIDARSNDDEVYFSVKDQGPGISQEDQKYLFRKFQKLSARPTAGETSNGLGLSIVKTIVTKLGGKIEVASVVGEGTTFKVKLPKVWVD